jgi:rhodanese-related sulfurtransferase
MKNMLRLFSSVLVFWSLCTALAWAAKDEFPGRATYPEVKYISLQDLKKRFDDVLIVDVRSSYEYQTLRIRGAQNIPVSSSSFVDNMAKLRAKTEKDIIVYCNGKTCMKSYKAARKCQSAKIPNVIAYDAGIMDWASTYPQQAILLGDVLGDPKKLISKKRFHSHMLEPDAFGEKVSSSNAIVLDVRDRFQRDALAIFPGRERRAYLDDTKKLDRYIRRAKQKNVPLMVYDAAGKQVRWFQYYLEKNNVHEYYFMKGGTRAYYKNLTNDFFGKK